MAWFIGCVGSANEPVAELLPEESDVLHVPLSMLSTVFENATDAPFATGHYQHNPLAYVETKHVPLNPEPHGRLGSLQHQPDPIHHSPLRPSSTCWSTPALSEGCNPGQR